AVARAYVNCPIGADSRRGFQVFKARAAKGERPFLHAARGRRVEMVVFGDHIYGAVGTDRRGRSQLRPITEVGRPLLCTVVSAGVDGAEAGMREAVMEHR